MRTKIVLLSLLLFIFLSGCDGNDNGCDHTLRERTCLYSVEKTKYHEAGVEVWAVADDGTEAAFFIPHDDVYFHDDSDRVIEMRWWCRVCEVDYSVRGTYLYLNKERLEDGY